MILRWEFRCVSLCYNESLRGLDHNSAFFFLSLSLSPLRAIVRLVCLPFLSRLAVSGGLNADYPAVITIFFFLSRLSLRSDCIFRQVRRVCSGWRHWVYSSFWGFGCVHITTILMVYWGSRVWTDVSSLPRVAFMGSPFWRVLRHYTLYLRLMREDSNFHAWINDLTLD